MFYGQKTGTGRTTISLHYCLSDHYFTLTNMHL